jgi:putative peptide zinc metalloprotease protein
MILYYTLFIPVGLLHELGHAVVCRRFGGETLEVGFVLSSANPVVKSNTAALETDRAKILYYAGGVFLDMFVFFILVNIWLRWPNYWTTLLLLPQTVFVLLFSYTMQAEQDFPKIVSQWTGIPEAGGRRAFLKEWLKNPPQKGLRTERTLVYAGTMVLQTVVFAFLVWSFRSPASVSLFPGVQVVLPFWPPILYVLYRMIRYTIFNFGRLTARLFPRPAEQTG